ncbi:MAG: DUF3788 domain-containing protein [Acidobacteriota bacterium]|jgi:hypothetical protein|nr:DUF3788 domain-containing protein [Acidobacteriota bacterium]
MALSAFDDKAREPTDSDVLKELADVSHLWVDLKNLVASQFDPLVADWVFSGKKWGWSLRLKHKKRAVLYMTPSTGFFYAGFALGEKAVAAANTSDLPRSLLEIINGSQKYAEGRGVRLEVWSASDLENVIKLAAIKMAN